MNAYQCGWLTNKWVKSNKPVCQEVVWLLGTCWSSSLVCQFKGASIHALWILFCPTLCLCHSTRSLGSKGEHWPPLKYGGLEASGRRVHLGMLTSGRGLRWMWWAASLSHWSAMPLWLGLGICFLWRERGTAEGLQEPRVECSQLLVAGV